LTKVPVGLEKLKTGTSPCYKDAVLLRLRRKNIKGMDVGKPVGRAGGTPGNNGPT